MDASSHVTIPRLILVGLPSFQFAFPLGNWNGMEWESETKWLRDASPGEDQTYNRSIIRISRLGESANPIRIRSESDQEHIEHQCYCMESDPSHVRCADSRQQVTELSRKVSRLRKLGTLKESMAESAESDAEKPSQRRKASKKIEKTLKTHFLYLGEMS